MTSSRQIFVQAIPLVAIHTLDQLYIRTNHLDDRNRNDFVVMAGGPLSNGVLSSRNNWFTDSFSVGVVVTFVL